MAREIFLTYRREDSAAWTGRIFEHLGRAFGSEQVFMDVDGIPAGRDFVTYLDRQIGGTQVALAVIGPAWLTATNSDGKPRIHAENDWVRLEIEALMRSGKTIIPVLVGGARMPRREDLPDSLKPLHALNAISVSHEKFPTDVAVLVKAVKQAAALQSEQMALNAGFGTWMLNRLGWIGSLFLGSVVGFLPTVFFMAIGVDEANDAVKLTCFLAAAAITGTCAYLFYSRYRQYSADAKFFNFMFGLAAGPIVVVTVGIGLLAIIPGYFYLNYRLGRA